MSSKWMLLVAMVAGSACAEGLESEPFADGRDDTFLVDGKADRIWLTQDDMRRVLHTVNHRDVAVLDDSARLDRRAAEAIVEFRRGPDGVDFTADDAWIESLQTLDDRPWVGPLAFERLVEHTRMSAKVSVSELLAGAPSWCEDATNARLENGQCAFVEHVIDGDTLELRLGDDSVARVRLRGIDTPECHKERIDGQSRCVDSPDGERFGFEAYATLQGLVDGAWVRIACETVDGECRHDLYDRYLAWPMIDDGYVDVAEVLVAGGFAWPYLPMQGVSTDDYCAAEDEARVEGRGLWADGVDAAIEGMSPDKRRWYANRADICP